MKRATIIIGAAVVVGGALAVTAAAKGGDEGPDQGARMPPELHQEYLQAVKDAGLEGQPGVTGRYVPGEGWELQRVEVSPNSRRSYLELKPDGTIEAHAD